MLSGHRYQSSPEAMRELEVGGNVVSSSIVLQVPESFGCLILSKCLRSSAFALSEYESARKRTCRVLCILVSSHPFGGGTLNSSVLLCPFHIYLKRNLEVHSPIIIKNRIPLPLLKPPRINSPQPINIINTQLIRRNPNNRAPQNMCCMQRTVFMTSPSCPENPER